MLALNAKVLRDIKNSSIFHFLGWQSDMTDSGFNFMDFSATKVGHGRYFVPRPLRPVSLHAIRWSNSGVDETGDQTGPASFTFWTLASADGVEFLGADGDWILDGYNPLKPLVWMVNMLIFNTSLLFLPPPKKGLSAMEREREREKRGPHITLNLSEVDRTTRVLIGRMLDIPILSYFDTHHIFCG